jgi:hypothetical protein
MRTGIATAIFLVAVSLTLFLYYYKFVRKGDAVEFVENHTILASSMLAAVVFFGTIIFGVKIALLLLAFTFLFFLLLINR